MRFKAEVDNVLTFSQLVQSIEKLQKKAIIKFTETDVHIICNADPHDGGVQVWSTIRAPSLFKEHRCEAHGENVITILVSTEHLLAVLRTAGNAHEVIMKLAKYNGAPVLKFEVTGVSSASKPLTIGHHIPIDILRERDVARLKEPMCPSPDTHIILPPLGKIRTIVERLRPLSDVVRVRADRQGGLEIGVETDEVRVCTAWRGCQVPEWNNEEEEERDPTTMHGVALSIKSFLRFLNCHVVSNTTIACLCNGYCLILYVYIGDLTGDVNNAGGVLTYYLPAIIEE